MTKRFKCGNVPCDANMCSINGKEVCMWKITKGLKKAAHDPKYKMCERLREGILNNKNMKYNPFEKGSEYARFLNK